MGRHAFFFFFLPPDRFHFSWGFFLRPRAACTMTELRYRKSPFCDLTILPELQRDYLAEPFLVVENSN